jgi:hypothetical protein
MEFGRTVSGVKTPGRLYAPLLIFFLISLSSLPSVSSQNEPKPEWKYVITSEDDNQVWETYYDSKSTERTAKGTIKVWLKQMPITKTEEERQRVVSSIIQNRKLNRMSISGYDKFAYSLTSIEFDCSKKAGRSVSIRDYDDSDKLLGSNTLPAQVPFAPVPEGSMARIVLNAVCK